MFQCFVAVLFEHNISSIPQQVVPMSYAVLHQTHNFTLLNMCLNWEEGRNA